MRRILPALLLALAVTLPSGCHTIRHDVGGGATQGVQVAQEKQWFALFGLISMNEVDGGQLAGDRTRYTIQTQRSFTDCMISVLTFLVTVFPKTVTITE